MYKYLSPIGLMKIFFDYELNKYALMISGEIYGHYLNPIAAADDVYLHVTGCYEWDELDGSLVDVPTDIHKWSRE